MALRGEQRALLQLLCERGQSYEDISGLLGVSSDDVRNQAREALGDLGGADPDAEVGLTDFLLGQADPIGRADAVRYLQTDPEALALAHRIEDELRAIAPEATLPKLPEPRGKRARAATAGAGEDTTPSPRRTGAPEAPAVSMTGADGEGSSPRQGRLIAALAAVGVILLVAILVITGVFSGDDEAPATAEVTTTADGSTTTTADDSTRSITSVQLAPVAGSGVAGSADFGLVSNQQLYVDLEVQGLDPTPARDEATLAWLMIGNSGGYPINNPIDSPIIPDENGNYSGRIAVPSAVALTVGSNATSVKLSSSPIREIAAAAREAAKQEAPILQFIGTELAAGEIPLVEGGAGAQGGGQGAGGGSTTPGG